ncbi:MAG: universal stress protein [Bacteroidota bacterium]
MKNILVPIDFSIFAISAAKTAAAIVSKSGGNIHLLNLIDIPVGWQKQPVSVQQGYPVLENRLVEAEIKMEKFAKLAFFKNCNVITHVLGGVAFEQIVIFAKSKKMDLIVMGIHGKGETEDKFIGSTAQRVIRTATCPVLSVKRGFNLGRVNKFLFASNFEENISSAMTVVKDLAIDFGANVDLAYINTPGYFVDDQTMEFRMKKFTEAHKKLKFNRVIHNSNEKEEGILQCAKKRHANIIAMVTHLRTVEPSYLISGTDGVLFHSKVPVLSFII